MTLKYNRAPLLYYIKLCASFQTHWWIQSGVTVQKCSIWVKIGDFLPCLTLKFDGWPWKTIRHLFFATSSFVNHFKTIGEFKLEWHSRNAQFGSKSAIFVPCDLEIWWMISKNNWAPLLFAVPGTAYWNTGHTAGTLRKLELFGCSLKYIAKISIETFFLKGAIWLQLKIRCENFNQNIFLKGKSIRKCHRHNVGHFFRPKYRLIRCLFFIKVYHQPKLNEDKISKNVLTIQ